MKRLLLIALLASAPAFAVTMVDGKVMLDERETALMGQCAAQGGCAVVSRAEVQQYAAMLREYWEAEIREAFAQSVKSEAEKVCRNKI